MTRAKKYFDWLKCAASLRQRKRKSYPFIQDLSPRKRNEQVSSLEADHEQPSDTMVQVGIVYQKIKSFNSLLQGDARV